MTADPKADAFVNNFAGQWLYLRNLPSAMPISFNFPDFDEALRASMKRETELFFDSVIREDRNIVDLLTADYTFVNERLARHYGIPDVYGARFRRVTLPPENWRENSVRLGLFGYRGDGSDVSIPFDDGLGNITNVVDRRYTRVGLYVSWFCRDLNIFGVYLHGKDSMTVTDPALVDSAGIELETIERAERAQHIVHFVDIAGAPAVGEALQLELEVGEHRRIEQLAQLVGTEQIAQQVAIERQRRGPSLGEGRVAFVHIDGDPPEQQRLRER